MKNVEKFTRTWSDIRERKRKGQKYRERYILSYIRAPMRRFPGWMLSSCAIVLIFAGYLYRLYTSFKSNLYLDLYTYIARPESSRRGQIFPIRCFSPRTCTLRRSCPRLGPTWARRTTRSRRVIRAWCCSWCRLPVSRYSTTTFQRRDCCCSIRRLYVPPGRRESPGARG